MSAFVVHCPLFDCLNIACEDCVLFGGRNGDHIECRLPEFPQETHGFYFGGEASNSTSLAGGQYVRLVVAADTGAVVLAPLTMRQKQAAYDPTNLYRPQRPLVREPDKPRPARRKLARPPQAIQPRLLEKLRTDLVYHSEALEGSPLTREEIENLLALGEIDRQWEEMQREARQHPGQEQCWKCGQWVPAQRETCPHCGVDEPPF